MHKTLRPFAKRLGVSSEAELRAFVREVTGALFTLDHETKQKEKQTRYMAERNNILTMSEFIRTHADVDARNAYAAQLYAIILQSIPGSRFYGNPKLARESAPDGRLYRLGCCIEALAEAGEYECFLCRERKPLHQAKGCTEVRDQDQTRRVGYCSDWFRSATFGWQTQLCVRCYKSVTDEYGVVDEEKEVAAFKRVMRAVARDQREERAA